MEIDLVMSKLVSIIIPVYNAEKYLDDCLTSVISQSYKDIEIIVINDGSTDNTREIVEKFKKQDNRIKVIHQENSGPSAARNRGMEESEGDYIQFVDADDVLNKHSTEIMMNKCNGSDLVIGRIYERDNINKSNKKDSFNIKRDYLLSVENFVSVFPKLFREKLINSPCNKLYDKRIIDRNNIKFPLKVNNGEDLVFNLQYIKASNRIKIIQDIVYEYRKINKNSLTLGYKDNYLDNRSYVFDSLISFIKEMNWLNNKLIIHFIEKTFTKYVVQVLENLTRNPNTNTYKIKLDIENILKHGFIINNFKYLQSYNLQTKLIVYFIRKNSVNGIYCYFFMKKIVRNRFKSIFRLLKRLNNITN